MAAKREATFHPFDGPVEAVMSDLTDDRPTEARERLMSALLRSPCLSCGAQIGQWCEPGCFAMDPKDSEAGRTPCRDAERASVPPVGRVADSTARPDSDTCVACPTTLAPTDPHGGLCCACRYDEQPTCPQCPREEPAMPPTDRTAAVESALRMQGHTTLADTLADAHTRTHLPFVLYGDATEDQPDILVCTCGDRGDDTYTEWPCPDADPNHTLRLLQLLQQQRAADLASS